ncbi:hypothetical protein ACWEWU_13960 [Staphylococcus xylosus]
MENLKEILEKSRDNDFNPTIKTVDTKHEVESVDSETAKFIIINTKSGSFLIAKSHNY